MTAGKEELSVYNVTDVSNTAFSDAVKVIRQFIVPFIVFVGLCGNTISLIVFSTRRMRRASSSVFLTALAVVDNLFLLSLLMSWLDDEVHDIISSNLSCQLLIYVTYVTSFLSVWCIVGFSCQRYIAICYPLKHKVHCTVFREKLIICTFALCASVLYTFNFWTSEIRQGVGAAVDFECALKREYIGFLTVATWIDTLFTMIIPFIVIVFVNTLVLCKRAHFPIQKMFSDRFLRKRYIETNLSDQITCNTDSLSSSVKARLNHEIRRENPKRNRKVLLIKRSRITTTLLAVSFTFLVLNLPAHTIRLYNLLTAALNNEYFVPVRHYLIQELTNMLYCTTFSCNFFLYTLFGRNFKSTLLLLVKCHSTKNVYRPS
ncbi:hypothetical protein DPMN_186607 [Dreissena polymorpha]|uniref:G-protein coupled receptors family 1 profile domain-containing protein n=1 Tax=Dreissena polymorpha TaxID=45954 RepID=A0A9D4DQM5_DREPO|nr:hypothetical protein DPMN_186607 [Dreissena polymorpha]